LPAEATAPLVDASAAERWAEWARTVTENGGAITFDMGPNWDAKDGPIGAISEAQMAQMAAVRQAVRGR